MTTWVLVIMLRAYGSMTSIPMQNIDACMSAKTQWEAGYPNLAPAFCLNTSTGEIKK